MCIITVYSNNLPGVIDNLHTLLIQDYPNNQIPGRNIIGSPNSPEVDNLENVNTVVGIYALLAAAYIIKKIYK